MFIYVSGEDREDELGRILKVKDRNEVERTGKKWKARSWMRWEEWGDVEVLGIKCTGLKIRGKKDEYGRNIGQV